MRAMRFAAGVHASGGFGIGGPINPSTEFPQGDEEIYLDSVTLFLKYYVRKHKAFSSAWLHFLLVVLVVFVAALRDSSEDVKLSNQSILENVANREQFYNIITSEDFYEWVTDVSTNCYLTRFLSTDTKGPHVMALNLFGVRMYRDKSIFSSDQTASLSAAYTQSATDQSAYQRQYFERWLFPWNFSFANAQSSRNNFVGDGNFDVSPIRHAKNSTHFFHSNRYLEDTGQGDYAFNGYFVDGVERDYPSTSKQYQVGPIIYSRIQSVQELQDLIHDYEMGGFISVGTRALVVDMVFMQLELGYYVHVSGLVEVLQGGNLQLKLAGQPFQVRSLSPPIGSASVRTIFIFIFDLLVFIVSFVLLANIVSRVRLSFILEGSVCSAILSFWEATDFLLLLLLWGTCACHFTLMYFATISAAWPDQNTLAPEVASMEYLCSYAAMDAMFGKVRSWALLLVFLRTFYLLQYVSRLAVMTETVQTSSRDIIGVTSISIVVVFGYSLGGYQLYGSNSVFFQDIFRAFAYLVQVIGSGEVRDYYDFDDASTSTPYFFLLFFFVVYFVLLNVVIGILAASFVTTVESYDLVRRADWSLRALHRDIVSLCQRFWPCLRSNKDAKNDSDDEQIQVQTSKPQQAQEKKPVVIDEVSPHEPFDLNNTEPFLSTQKSTERKMEKEEKVVYTTTEEHQKEREKKEVKKKSAGIFSQRTKMVTMDDDFVESSYSGADEHEDLEEIERNMSKYGIDRQCASYLRLLQALVVLQCMPRDQQLVSLRQLHNVCRRFMSEKEINVVFQKAQQQIGTSDGKTRHIRLLSRRMQKGKRLMNDVSVQYAKILQIRKLLLGDAARTARDDEAVKEEDGVDDEGNENTSMIQPPEDVVQKDSTAVAVGGGGPQGNSDGIKESPSGNLGAAQDGDDQDIAQGGSALDGTQQTDPLADLIRTLGSAVITNEEVDVGFPPDVLSVQHLCHAVEEASQDVSALTRRIKT